MASTTIESITVSPRKFKSTLVYYYMPNCPYCREFAPVFVKLAKISRELPEYKLAAVDITQHENVGVPIKSVPTLMYFDKKGKAHKMQASSSDERSLVNVASFLKEQKDQDL